MKPSLQIRAKAITNSNKIFNICNIYFRTIGEDAQSKINRCHQNYNDHFVGNITPMTTPTLFLCHQYMQKKNKSIRFRRSPTNMLWKMLFWNFRKAFRRKFMTRCNFCKVRSFTNYEELLLFFLLWRYQIDRSNQQHLD